MNARLLASLLLTAALAPRTAGASATRPATMTVPKAGAATPAAAPKAPEARHVKVGVTEAGFEPAEISAKSGEHLVLEITRVTDETCATAIVIPSQKVKVALPLNTPVEVPVTAGAAGRVAFACPMNMITGAIVVKE